MSKPKIKDARAASTRREFAKSLAVIAAAPIVSRAAGVDPVPQQTPPADALSPAAESLTDVVRQRHGKHLTEDQLNLVKRNIDRAVRNADRMKQFKLVNGDEPAFAFTADV